MRDTPDNRLLAQILAAQSSLSSALNLLIQVAERPFSPPELLNEARDRLAAADELVSSAEKSLDHA